MKISDLIAEGANVYVTVSVADLREFFEEVAKDTAAKERAVDAQNYDDTMTQKEVCEYLGVSKTTLWRWEKIGYLVPSARMGARPMYKKSVVEKLKYGL